MSSSPPNTSAGRTRESKEYARRVKTRHGKDAAERNADRKSKEFARMVENRHGKDAAERNADNPGYQYDAPLLMRNCKTGVDGISGIATADELMVEYYYAITTDRSIEEEVQGIILPALEEFINDDLAGLLIPGCFTGSRRLSVDPAPGIDGISTNPQDLVQGNAGEFCPESDIEDEACDFVKGGLTVFTTGDTVTMRGRILDAVRAGMTSSTFRGKPRLAEAHPAILDIRFIDYDSSSAISAPPPSSGLPVAPESAAIEDGTPRLRVSLLIAAAAIVALLVAAAIYGALTRKRREATEDGERDKDFSEVLEHESFTAGDVGTVGTSSPPPSPLHAVWDETPEDAPDTDFADETTSMVAA